MGKKVSAKQKAAERKEGRQWRIDNHLPKRKVRKFARVKAFEFQLKICSTCKYRSYSSRNKADRWKYVIYVDSIGCSGRNGKCLRALKKLFPLIAPLQPPVLYVFPHHLDKDERKRVRHWMREDPDYR